MTVPDKTPMFKTTTRFRSDHLRGIIRISNIQEGVGAGPCPAPVRGNANMKDIDLTDEPFPFFERVSR